MDKKTFIQKAIMLQAKYVPSDVVKAQLAQLDLVIAVGATGAGKTTIMEHSGFPYVLSDVTREPRKQERDGVDYNFRNDYDQLWAEVESGQFVQYVVSQTGEFYGTKAASYPPSGVCTTAIYANIKDFFQTLGFRKVIAIYIVPPSYDEWTKRAKANHDNETKKRMMEAKESMELALSDSSYYFLVNDDLYRAIQEFKDVANGQIADPASQERARETMMKLLTQIDIY